MNVVGQLMTMEALAKLLSGIVIGNKSVLKKGNVLYPICSYALTVKNLKRTRTESTLDAY